MYPAFDILPVLLHGSLGILAHLTAHAGEIVSRADLIDVLWENQIYIDDNTLSRRTITPEEVPVASRKSAAVTVQQPRAGLYHPPD